MGSNLVGNEIGTLFFLV